MLRALPLIVLGVSACADASGDYPRLLPTEQILAEPELPAATPEDAEATRRRVEAQGAATQARAEAIADPVDDAVLAARAADLRRRAEALRNATQNNCPPDDNSPDCPTPAH